MEARENGSTALLLKGARRVGKSTVAKAFAENEYKSYILIDFAQASKEVKQLFDNLMDLNYIFLRLQSIYQVILEPRKSAIISMKYKCAHKPGKPSNT